MTHAGGHHGGGSRHGNPVDLDRYLARMEAPDRAEWQQPGTVVDALELRRGDVVADVGAGPGYFSLRLAHAVGPQGRVYAVEVVPEIMAVLRERIDRAEVANVTPILAAPDDPGLPPRSCDAVLLVNTFHHFPDGVAYLRRLASSLKPGGRIVDVDFHKRAMPVGPPIEHKVAYEDFMAAAAAAGLAPVRELTSLPYQYVVVLRSGAGP